jgi:hypothetical protein
MDVTDPQVRRVLEVARAWGVPLSEFMGKVRVTQHFSQTGSITGYSETQTWTEEDRQYALALAQYEAECCPNCKEPLEETSKAENEFRYRAEVPIRCHRCTATEIATDEAQSRPHPAALLIPIRLREPDATTVDR